jgi:hypothetical protein
MQLLYAGFPILQPTIQTKPFSDIGMRYINVPIGTTVSIKVSRKSIEDDDHRTPRDRQNI